MNLGILKEPILQLIGTAILGAVSITIVFLNKKITKWFLDSIWTKLSFTYKHGKLNKKEIERDSKVREILIELRTIVNADRTCLFKFHNGSVFTTKNPIWKVSNTHESVSPGISSEIGHLQDMKASSLIEVLQAFWREEYITGVEKISPEYCSDCSNITKSCNDKKIIFINVNNLEDCYSKSLLVEQGIKYVLDAPIYKDGNCVGFVAVNYCSEIDIEKIKNTAHDICRNTAQIKFLMLG